MAEVVRKGFASKVINSTGRPLRSQGLRCNSLNQVTVLSHKIRIYPNKEAEVYLKRSCGTARFAYNWARARWEESYKAGEKPNVFALLREFNGLKATEYPWVLDVSKWAPQRAILNLGEAYQRFFSKTSRHPKFKCKGKSNDSFYLNQDSIKVSGKYLTVPKLKKPIKLAQEIRFKGQIKFVTISQNKAGEWHASFTIELAEDFIYDHECESQARVGVDLGLKTWAKLSNGEQVDNQRPLQDAERRLCKRQRSLARKVKGSKNRAKARIRLAKAHLKVTRIRQDATHRATSMLVKTFRFIGIEDLNVRGLTRNHRLAKSLQDAAFGEFRRQLEYKAKLARSFVIKADRFFPSSKMCSCCEHVLESLALSEREWTCPACGAHHDRDENAAKNLELVAQRYWETLNACGEDVRPNAQAPTRARKEKGERVSRRQTSVKQECQESPGVL